MEPKIFDPAPRIPSGCMQEGTVCHYPSVLGKLVLGNWMKLVGCNPKKSWQVLMNWSGCFFHPPFWADEMDEKWGVNGKSSSRRVNRRRILRSASCGCSLLGKRRHYLPHQGHPAQQLSWTRSRPGRGKYALPGEQRATWSWQGGLQGWDSLGVLVLAQKRNGLVDDVY